MRDIGEAFAALVHSTNALHERFDTAQTVEQAFALFQEEAGEFGEEALSSFRMAYPLTEEAVDVIVTVLGVLRAAGVDDGALAAIMQAVAAKNDAKTHDTHEVNAAGKIARKQAGVDA